MIATPPDNKSIQEINTNLKNLSNKIEKFNKTSTILSCAMIGLTIAIAILTLLMIF